MSAPTAWWAPWALPVIGAPIEDALITVRDGRVVSVEGGVRGDDPRLDAAGVERFDRCVVAPGFVNAHCHLEYAAYEGITDALPFAAWIADHMHRKRRLQAGHMRASAQLGAWQAAAGGITTVGDASFSGDAAHALAEVGLRGRVYLELFGTDDAQAKVDEVVARLAQLPSSELVSHGISPHAPYTVAQELYRAVAATGLPWMTHLLESEDELEFLRSASGPLFEALSARGLGPHEWDRSPIEALADVLGPRSVIVHAVHASDRDIEVIAGAGAPVVHCPRSNARLGCGVMPLAQLERAGALVALGTDSPASAGAIDMFAEMRAAIELHRAATKDASWPDAAYVLRMATAEAALALGYDDVGVIAPGAQADLVAHAVGPTRDPVQAVVLRGEPRLVRATLVGGQTVWRHDMNALDRAREAAAEARSLLELPVPAPVSRQSV